MAAEIRDRGVSKVVGVVLMTAIVVLLAATVAATASGFTDKLRDPAPSGSFEQEYFLTGEGNTDYRPYVEITHQVGRTVDADNVVIRDESGNQIRWDEVWTGGPKVKASEYVHIDGFGSDSALDPICSEGDQYIVVLQNDQGETLMINEWEAPADPQLPPEAGSDSDDDGIPDWC